MDDAEVIKMLRMGFKPKEIRLADPDISPNKISSIRKSIGMEPFKRGRLKGSSPEVARKKLIAREMKVAGKSYREIGIALGVSSQRAQQYLRVIPKVKANHCSLCGKPTPSPHYHHTDYAKNAVIPLCASCHRKQEKSKALIEFERLFSGRKTVGREEVFSAINCSENCYFAWCRKFGIEPIEKPVSEELKKARSSYAKKQNDLMTANEKMKRANLGGKARWEGIAKKFRSDEMRRIRQFGKLK